MINQIEINVIFIRKIDGKVDSLCIYCDHKFRIDEDEEFLYYRCPSCRLNDSETPNNNNYITI